MIGVLALLGLAALIWAAVGRRAGRDSGKPGDPHGVRRFFQYTLLYGLFVVVAFGSAGLVGRILGAGSEGPVLIGRREVALARDLSFFLIGAPLYAGLGWWSLKRLRSEPEERRSLGWLIYSTAATVTALGVAMGAVHDVAAALFGSTDLDRWAAGRAVVWGLAWFGHRIVVRRIPSGTPELPLIAGSAIGLVVAAGGLSSLLSGAIEVLIQEQAMVSRSPLGDAGATLVVGAAAWVAHWSAALKMERSPLWLGYVFVFGVGGGLLAALAAAGVVFRDVLVWFVGDPRTPDATRHFDDLPGAVSVALVAGIVWWYHRAVVHRHETERAEPRRIYEYLVAGIGLLAAAGGSTALLVGFLEAVSGARTIVEGDTAVNTLLGAATYLVIGSPVWWSFWRRIQSTDLEAEVTSPTRRFYLFAVLGSGVVVGVSALITATFIVLEGVLGGDLRADILFAVRLAAASLVIAAVVVAYHWAIYRSDRARSPAPQGGPRYVLLIGPADKDVVRAVRERTGAEVQLWTRTDQVPPWSADEVVESLAGISDDEVVVVAGPEGPRVMGVERA